MPSYLAALLITIAVEFFVYLVIIRQKPLQLFLYSVLINGLTQPIALWALNRVILSSYNPDLFYLYFIIIEIIVFLAEIFLVQLLLRVKLIKALIISFSANLITALLSFVF